MKKNWLHNERLIILSFWVMLFFVFWLQVMPQTKSFFESIDYLMKPIAFQRFFQAVSKAQDLLRSQLLLHNGNEDTLSNMYVRQGDTFLRVDIEDILYAEGMQNYVRLFLKDRVLTIRQTMSSLEELLPQEAFFRIHKSYLVNVSHIDSIAGLRLFAGGKELPISKQRREELLNSVVYKKLISK